MEFEQCVAGLTQEKMMKVSNFRITANVELAKDSLPSMSLSQAVKYLYAAKFDVKKAEDIFRNYQKCYFEYGLFEVRKQSLNAEIRSKKLEILGARDNDGAQILLLTVSRHDTRTCDHKTAVQLLFLLLDQISESISTQSKGVTLLVDLQCCSPVSCDTKYTSSILSILDGGYPLYLNMVYIIEAPGWFRIARDSPSFINLQKNGKTKMVSLGDLSSLISPSSLPHSLYGSLSSNKSAAAVSSSSSEMISRNKSPPKSNPPLTPPPRSNKVVKKESSLPNIQSPEPSVEELQLSGNVNKIKDIFQATPTSPPPVKPHPIRSAKPHSNGISPIHKPMKVMSVPGDSSPKLPFLPPVSPKNKVISGQRTSKEPKPLLKKSDSDDRLNLRVTPISGTSLSAEEVILPREEEEKVAKKVADDLSLSKPSKFSGKNIFKPRQDMSSNGGGANGSEASDNKVTNKFGNVFKREQREKKTTPLAEPDKKHVTDNKEEKKQNGGGGGKVSVKIFGGKSMADPGASSLKSEPHTATTTTTTNKPQQPGSPSKWSRSQPKANLLQYENVSVKPTKPLERINNNDTSSTPVPPLKTNSTQPYKVTVISSDGPSPPPPPSSAPPPPPSSAPPPSVPPPSQPEYAVIRKPNKIPPPTHTVSPPTHAVSPTSGPLSPPPLLPPQYSDEDLCLGGNETKLHRNPYENIFFMSNEEDEDEGEILNYKDDEIIYENFGPDRGNRWMTISELQQYVNDKGKKELSAEYLKIKNEPITGTANHFKLPCNNSKNRYKDVVCYDSTRVVLSKISEEEGSDYIHANYINGFQRERAVILTQGPLKRTVNDYWRMLWEKEVFVIVMATKCIETRKLKCAQYWPDGTSVATFGDISVRVVKDEVYDSYQFRQFTAKRNGETRTLMHYQFLAWPDYGVPASGSEVLEVLYAARAMQDCYREHVKDPDRFPIHGPPMVIHCSAGIGRSGTFCSLDYCIDELRMTNKVNVQNCVRLLRKQRAFSIQTDEQYIFCYKTVLNYGLELKAALKR